jgi:hypothetical protein
LGAIIPIVGKIFTLPTDKQTNTQKTPELQFVHIPELHVEVYLKKLEILPTPHQYILSLMNFIVNNKETFQTN